MSSIQGICVKYLLVIHFTIPAPFNEKKTLTHSSNIWKTIVWKKPKRGEEETLFGNFLIYFAY